VEGERVRLSALTGGKLALIDGCLRLTREGETGNGDLIIWPDDHSPGIDENGTIQVSDSTGLVVARLGETIFMGGGESKSISALKTSVFGLQEEIPAECSGPYWIMGNVILHPGAYPGLQR
jgi:hypothetical protein